MSDSTNNGSDGVLLLTLVFVVLKLAHVIAWSWWWVFCPIWIPILLWLTVVVIFLAFVVLIAIGAAITS